MKWLACGREGVEPQDGRVGGTVQDGCVGGIGQGGCVGQGEHADRGVHAGGTVRGVHVGVVAVSGQGGLGWGQGAGAGAGEAACRAWRSPGGWRTRCGTTCRVPCRCRTEGNRTPHSHSLVRPLPHPLPCSHYAHEPLWVAGQAEGHTYRA